MKKIETNSDKNNLKLKKILKITINSSDKKKKNFFSPKESIINLNRNKKFIHQSSTSFHTNNETSTPLTNTTSNFHKIKESYSNRKQKKLPSINVDNMYTFDRLNKKRKNLKKDKDTKATISPYINYLNSSSNKKIQINSNPVLDNLGLKSKVKGKEINYANLLIEKTETQFPLSTYFLSPTYENNNSISGFNKLGVFE